MVPRIHKRGTSFKGACGYVLHDPGKTSSDRVAFIETRNLYDDPQYAWFEMFDTYRNRSALKLNAGVDMRGRDNKAPVLHFTLSWHLDDHPGQDHMKTMAVDSLEALGLSEHQAIIVAHDDKQHCHLHVVANTVHPYTGKTAPLKFSKLEFSKWAEKYEREHGIHCLERIKNNERRRELANQREAERREALQEMAEGHTPPAPKPYEPVKDHSPNRRQWFERKKVIDTMKALRAALDREQRDERAATAAKHRRERDALDRAAQAAIDRARADVNARCKPRWRDLYRTHRSEEKHIARVATHPLERAVYVFRNRERLGDKDRPLTLRQMIPLFVSGRKLKARIKRTQARERAELARKERLATRLFTDKVYAAHKEKLHALRDRQEAERNAERAHHEIERKDISFARAKEELLRALGAPAAEENKTPAKPERQDAKLRQPANTSQKTAPPPEPKLTPNAVLMRDAKVPQGVPTVPKATTPEPNPQQRPAAPSELMRDAKMQPGVPTVRPLSGEELSPPGPRVPPGVPTVPKTAQVPQPKPRPFARDLMFGEHERMQGVPAVPPAQNPAQPPAAPPPKTWQRLSPGDAQTRDQRAPAPSPAQPVTPAPRAFEKPKHAQEPLTKIFRRAASPEPDPPQPEKEKPDLGKTFRRHRHRNIRRDFDRER